MKGYAGDIAGLAGLALAARGVFELWGRGWMLLSVGSLVLAVYLWIELGAGWRRPKRKEG